MTEQDNTQAGIIWLASYPKSGNTWARSFLFNLISILTGEDPSTRDINAVNERSIWDISARRYEEILGKPPKEAGREATGFFFFAGHGVQSEGLNYLIPVDTVAYTEADIWANAPRLELLFRYLENAGNGANFIVHTNKGVLQRMGSTVW